MDVTAIGRTRMLYDAVRAVAEAGHRIERVVTCGGEDFYEVTASDFRELATDLGAKFVVPDDATDPDLLSTFEESDSEIAVSVNRPTLLPRRALDAFDNGIVNGHAGDLPRYRGNAAPNWAIINGEDAVVLTVHRMAEDLDAGPILAQRRVPLDEDTYIGDVYREMFEGFPELFVEVVDAAADGRLDPRPQPSDPSAALRGYPRKPADSELRWEESASHLARVVRASAEPLFGAYTWLDGRKVRVWRAHEEQPAHDYLGTPGQVAERRPREGTVAVVSGDGFLVLETLQREGVDDERRPATDVVEGSRARFGMDVTGTLAELRWEVDDLRRRVNDLSDQS